MGSSVSMCMCVHRNLVEHRTGECENSQSFSPFFFSLGEITLRDTYISSTGSL